MTDNIIANVWFDNENIENMIGDYCFSEGIEGDDVAQSDIDNVIEEIDEGYLEDIMQEVGERYLYDVVNKYCEGIHSQRENRCTDCAYLIEDEDGNWICDDCQRDIHCIPDDECSAEQEW